VDQNKIRDHWSCSDCAGGPCLLNTPGNLSKKDNLAPTECPYGNGTECVWEIAEGPSNPKVLDIGLFEKWWRNIPQDRRPYGSDLWDLIRMIRPHALTTGFVTVPDKPTYSK